MHLDKNLFNRTHTIFNYYKYYIFKKYILFLG